MADSIDISSLIADELALYSDEVSTKVKKVCKNKAKQLAENISNDSPKKTGGYAKGWTSKTLDEDKLTESYVVYNKKKPQLTHLLENGYATKNGGRVAGRAHIKPNEEKMEDELLKDIEKSVSGE